MGVQVEGHAKHNAAAHRCKEEEVESKASRASSGYAVVLNRASGERGSKVEEKR